MILYPSISKNKEHHVKVERFRSSATDEIRTRENDRVETCCLTTWRQPHIKLMDILEKVFTILRSKSALNEVTFSPSH